MLNTFQFIVDFLHDKVKLIPVWLSRWHRILIHPTTTSKLIEVVTWAHSHVHALQQVSGWKRNLIHFRSGTWDEEVVLISSG